MVLATLQTSKTDEYQLKERARQFVVDYPDLHQMAHMQALKILRKHTDRSFDPDKVYWHRFSGASSSSRSFTGWQHVGTPVESMTLTQLVVHRFNAHDQEASDELQMYGGFYTVGPDHGVFNETNEVPLLPLQVMQDFWALDFDAQYRSKMQQFWTAHNENFLILAKARWLAAAGNSLRDGTLLRRDFQIVLRAVMDTPVSVMTLDRLQTAVQPPTGVTLHLFKIEGYAARDIVRIVDQQQRQILYVPGDQTPFQVFETELELYEWVRSRVTDAASRAAFTDHFLHSAASKSASGAAFDATLDNILRLPWDPEKRLINSEDHLISGNAFVYFRDIARQEMETDAHFLLTSNTNLRKQIWIGYLNAFLKVSGPLAPLGWPVALTVVGAGIANIWLNADQAVNGATAVQRKAGLVGAILNGIFVCFNLPLLASARSGGWLSAAESSNEVTAFPEIFVHTPPVLPVDIASSGADSLVGFEDNVILSNAESVSTDGTMRGIHQLHGGQTAINLGGRAYRVRFYAPTQHWGIVDPANPYAFYGFKPVRLNASGEWELAPESRLSGGSPMDEAGSSTRVVAPSGPGAHFSTIESPFWDTYMQFNLPEEQRLSELALHRQETVMQVLQLESGDEVVSDSEGEEVHIDGGGNKHYVFRTADDVYVGRHIKRYTEEDVAYNQFLRTGTPHSTDQVKVIEELVDDLGHLALNNDVALYRGGSGGRGTSGRVFRGGGLKSGDVLVNTDITSFSENPYLARVFASSQAGEASAGFTGEITFDDTAVVFVLPAKSYIGATPIAPFSWSATEAESVFLPGHYFKINSIDEVVGENYRFMRVQLQEVPKPGPGEALYDLRTGAPFSREAYAIKLGPQAKPLVDLFFPVGN